MDRVYNCEMDVKPVSTVYRFKITLVGIWPLIWRRILVPNNFTFYQLHVAIQNAVGWKDRNCHDYDNHYWRAPGPPDKLEKFSRCAEPVDQGDWRLFPRDLRVRDYFVYEKDALFYTYDLDSRWEHTVVLERVSKASENVEYPLCVGGERACPPECLGGSQMYDHHLSIVTNPEHPLHEECKTWLALTGSTDQPEVFNHEEVVFEIVTFEDCDEFYHVS